MEQPLSHAYVVILAGGGGTRLWPHSVPSRPKQFLPLLGGGETLIGATARRTRLLCPMERTLVVTAAEQVGEVRRCLPDLPVDNILVEPIGRNTAPCIGLAATLLLRRDRDAILAVLPSDHHVRDERAFVECLREALGVAARGHVVTLGVPPTRPETGYGYIQAGERAGERVRVVESFVEKPSRDRALSYIAAGNYLWNSGTFFFPARRVLDEIARYQQELAGLLDEIARHPERTAALYPEAPALSIDYAVMEHLGRARVGESEAIRVLPADFGWDDVGSFAALAELSPEDAAGNHVVPGAGSAARPPLFLDARSNIVWSSTGQQIACVGIHDLVIAATEDAILVVPRARAQEVREVVKALERSS